MHLETAHFSVSLHLEIHFSIGRDDKKKRTMTVCARTFSGNCVSSHLGRVSATGKQGSPDATDWTLRNEDSAQQGVSSLPLHAQIMACSLHSGGEGGSQKQIRKGLIASFTGYVLLLCCTPSH